MYTKGGRLHERDEDALRTAIVVSKVIPQRRAAVRTVALAALFLNLGVQFYLWISLGYGVLHGVWGQSLWSIFTLGLVLAWVGWIFQAREYKEDPSLPALLGLIALRIACIGNVVDLFVMGFAGVPITRIDAIPVGAALFGYGVLNLPLIKNRFAFLKALGSKDRFMFTAGFATRVVVIAVTSSIAIWRGVSPIGIHPLIAMTVIGVTFVVLFTLQRATHIKATKRVSARANQYLFSWYVADLVVFTWTGVILASL